MHLVLLSVRFNESVHMKPRWQCNSCNYYRRSTKFLRIIKGGIPALHRFNCDFHDLSMPRDCMHSANDGIYIPVRATERVASINCTGLVAVRRV